MVEAITAAEGKFDKIEVKDIAQTSVEGGIAT